MTVKQRQIRNNKLQSLFDRITHKIYWELFRQIGETELDERIKVYIVSHPKCGRTWLRMMVGKALCDRYNLDEKFILNTKKLTDKAGIPLVDWTHEHSGDLGAGSWTGNRFVKFAKDKSAFKDKKVVFLMRDPKDVMVSFYFHKIKRASTLDFKGSISEFIRSRRLGVKKLIEFYNIWYQNQKVPEDFLLVKYEDLRADTFNTLKSVLDFIGLKDASDNIIGNAIHFSSFDNMKRMEKENVLDSNIMQSRDIKDVESYKVRKGKVGGYIDYLSPKDIEYIDRVISKIGCPFLQV